MGVVVPEWRDGEDWSSSTTAVDLDRRLQLLHNVNCAFSSPLGRSSRSSGEIEIANDDRLLGGGAVVDGTKCILTSIIRPNWDDIVASRMPNLRAPAYVKLRLASTLYCSSSPVGSSTRYIYCCLKYFVMSCNTQDLSTWFKSSIPVPANLITCALGLWQKQAVRFHFCL